MGFRSQKHNFSVLGVKYQLFHLKGPFLLSQVILDLIMNPFRNKKVCAPLKKWALDPKNTENHVFGVKHPFFHLRGPVLISGIFHQKMAI